MSIFSQPVSAAADINLFGRVDGDRQQLVIGMRISASTDTALIVPLPIRPGCGDHEVKLTLLTQRRAFFAAIAQGFQSTANTNQRRDEEEDDAPRTVRYTYADPIQTVYVPSPVGFNALDEAFRLPRAVLAANPQYGSYAFLVHVLPAGHNIRVVPVAVEFPTRDPAHIFFPTVVSLGGPVADVALQDVTVYTQRVHHLALDETRDPAGDFMVTDGGIVAPEHLVQRQVLYGSKPNEDTRIALG
jgi:hypothetical protein